MKSKLPVPWCTGYSSHFFSAYALRLLRKNLTFLDLLLKQLERFRISRCEQHCFALSMRKYEVVCVFKLASPENHAVKSLKSYNLAELLFSTTPQMKFLQCSLASETSVPFLSVCGKIIPALNLELFIRAILIIKTIDIMSYMHYSPKDNKHLISMATTRSTRSPPEVKA